MRQLRILSVAALCWLAGCTTTEVMIAHSVDLVEPTAPVDEDKLLDVGIVVFDPGVPEGEIPKDVLEELIREGTFVQTPRLRLPRGSTGHGSQRSIGPRPMQAPGLPCRYPG